MISLACRTGVNRLILATLVAAGAQGLVASGCAPGESIGSGTAGTTGAGTAGTTGAAGTSGSAGTPGTAGTSNSGAAGTSSSGSAGTTGAGGSISTGTAGGGGTSATTNTDPATFAYLYNSSVEGWVLNNYADGGRANLADPARASTPAPTIAVDTAVGNPDAGSLKVTAHFTDWKQYVDAVINVSPPKTLTGRVLRARVRLTSGSFGGGAQIHAGTGSSYRFAAGVWTTMTVGNWTELAIDLDAARAADAMFDPSMVVQIGVKFDTGGDGLVGGVRQPRRCRVPDRHRQRRRGRRNASARGELHVRHQHPGVHAQQLRQHDPQEPRRPELTDDAGAGVGRSGRQPVARLARPDGDVLRLQAIRRSQRSTFRPST